MAASRLPPHWSAAPAAAVATATNIPCRPLIGCRLPPSHSNSGAGARRLRGRPLAARASPEGAAGLSGTGLALSRGVGRARRCRGVPRPLLRRVTPVHRAIAPWWARVASSLRPVAQGEQDTAMRQVKQLSRRSSSPPAKFTLDLDRFLCEIPKKVFNFSPLAM